jgi:hypothetical protein
LESQQNKQDNNGKTFKVQVPKWFSYAIRYLEDEKTTAKLPIISWHMVKNYVAPRGMQGEKMWNDEQILSIKYIQDGKEKEKEIFYRNFYKMTKKSDHIFAKSIKNTDWTPVYISKEIHPEHKFEFYKLKPETSELLITLPYEGKDYTILSTYLNA